ncbi:ABC transporter permease [Candidatus Nanohalococcus occultus]
MEKSKKKDDGTGRMKLDTVRKYIAIYWSYFKQYWKTRLIYKTDFTVGAVAQLVNLGASLAFLTLLFTQVDSINGWSFNEMLFLAGIGGVIMNFHHLFLFNMFSLEDYIVDGKLDRFLLRPLSPLFQIYADKVSDNNLSKLIANAALVIYSGTQIGVNLLSLPNLVYGAAALISGTLVFAAAYMVFATTGFWTGRSRSAIWLIFRLSEYRRYPFGIYTLPIQVILVTAIPIAFASFFPATFFLEKTSWQTWQYISIAAGPVLYSLALKFWTIGLGNYSSTGS